MARAGYADRWLAKVTKNIGPGWEVCTLEEALSRDYDKVVTTIFGGKATIRASQEGSVCDPSTESYWSA